MLPLDRIVGLCAIKLIAIITGPAHGEVRVVRITENEYHELAAWLRAQPSKIQQPEDLPLPESREEQRYAA